MGLWWVKKMMKTVCLCFQMYGSLYSNKRHCITIVVETDVFHVCRVRFVVVNINTPSFVFESIRYRVSVNWLKTLVGGVVKR